MSIPDFRVRKLPDRECYRVVQRVGSGWESLADWYPSRAHARAAIDRMTRGCGA